ncbi:unnamed protein product [Litomosoides sigmodontis]|uniref:Uncharacterized protein n=1 Tax=Litomosoides sigmodontis TaxID=42156 RepID=A0A3P6TB93_LITSI|nr:unnamed protein product [Litomosoides sigmodontis]
MTENGTVGWWSFRNIQQTTVATIPYLLPTLLFSIISVTACGKRSRHDENAESESCSYTSKSGENQTENKSTQETSTRKLPVTPITGIPAEKDAQIPESVVTEEIFVPIGKSARDPPPPKGAMTANRNKITAQTGTGMLPHMRLPTSIRFTEERHRSRTVNIFSEQKPKK